MTDKATPRPWRLKGWDICADELDSDGDDIVVGCVGRSYGARSGIYTVESRRNQANAELIVAAVNSYDPAREEKIRKLVEAAKASMNCHYAMNERAFRMGLVGTSVWDAVAFDSLSIGDELRAALQDMEKPE